ncbi:MAG: pyridoxamine 5'-phosphate oxidase family protein [Polyangiales bacterium]
MSGAPTGRKLAVWHAGEKAIQEKVGVAARMQELGKRIVRDFMPDQHREFYAQLPFLVAGSVDPQGDAWATLIEGEPGFVSSPHERALDIDTQPDASDPASAGMRTGDAIGLLGIELHTRRRNRANGTLRATEPVLQLALEQSFGNCPRYIQLRHFELVRDPREPYAGQVEVQTALDAEARATIQSADTFFVATYADREGQRQVDVSHRGGKPGFVRVSDDGTLTIPDFDGNLFFNTLGNILLNGKAGLVFVDFASGDLLQLSGDAEVSFDSPEIGAFQGAERLWHFRARRVVRRRDALALRGTTQDGGQSPNVLMTGDWKQAAERLRAAALPRGWRAFKVSKVVDESTTIRSFTLQPDDGGGLVPHQAGQHLPIRIAIDGKPLVRTYSLSVAPSDGVYRISVKRDGAVSRCMHEHLRVGDSLEVRAPAGSFTLDARTPRPAVLLGAGVGITPLLAMLRHIVHEGLRVQNIRPTVLFHAARSKAERPFDAELASLEQQAHGAVRIVRVLGSAEGAQPEDFDAVGRLDVRLLSRFIPTDAYDYYLCGPAAFTQSLYDGLRARGIADERLHAEAFGPSSLVRTGMTERLAASKVSLPVLFVSSMKEARWTPESGTLLELAEARGLSPDFECRSGSCGTCRTKLLAGKVAYVRDPTAEVGEGEVLICSAVPAEQEGALQLAL